ncbi:MAG TPA: methionine--tRNA ligase [Patescibacteria group bacterium]|nr:methionine--tRNA ligase [Patescibacteria group bacterium]
MNKFYITTAIPYVNGKPHLGHALEYFQADTIRRYQQKLGKETLLLSGADENALKNVQAAEKENIPVTKFLEKNSRTFEEAFSKLGVKLDVFQRGSDQKLHWPGVQKLWKLCAENGDIYKKSYEGLYCVGCESFKTESELTSEGLCPEHLVKPELVKEENYFFRLSKYQKQILDLIEKNTLQIIPENKRAETLGFVKKGLEDFSISRSKKRAKGVGVPVPDDPNQVMYVWFDALTIYMTGVGFATDEEKWKKWWPADVHIIGKDINRFHTVYWPAMLLSAKLPLPKTILIHSFVLAQGGQKMSKSLGNVVDPFDLAEKFGVEALRYYLLSQISLSEDGEISPDRFKEVYNADLANGLGNLVARVAKLCELVKYQQIESQEAEHIFEQDKYLEALNEFRFNDALAFVWKKISAADKYIDETKPWELIKKEDPRLRGVLSHLVGELQEIAQLLEPFLPQTAQKIEQQFKGPEIISTTSMFPRIN